MLRRSLLHKSIRGLSEFSSIHPGLCSGEESPLLRSRGTLPVVGGGEVAGLNTEVGLLALDDVDKSKAPIREFKGELRDSFLALTGDDVLERDNGGGEENLRQRCGDFPSKLWLVAKNNSKDLTGIDVKGFL